MGIQVKGKSMQNEKCKNGEGAKRNTGVRIRNSGAMIWQEFRMGNQRLLKKTCRTLSPSKGAPVTGYRIQRGTPRYRLFFSYSNLSRSYVEAMWAMSPRYS